MYYYVYDEFVQDTKYERDLSLIETRLTDLGISGKIARLALFRDASELIRDEVRRGVKTVVAVGNDETLQKVMDAVADTGVALALIPLGAQNRIADLLGVPAGVEACDVLSARMIQELDIGSVNGMRFLHEVVIHAPKAPVVNCDGQFSLNTPGSVDVEVRNLALADEDVRAANPTDGRLEIALRVPKSGWFSKKSQHTTLVPVEQAVITSDVPMTLTTDGQSFEAKEFYIKAIPSQLRVVTGRGRKF